MLVFVKYNNIIKSVNFKDDERMPTKTLKEALKNRPSVSEFVKVCFGSRHNKKKLKTIEHIIIIRLF